MHKHSPTDFDPEDIDIVADVIIINYNGKNDLSLSLSEWVSRQEEGYINNIIIVDNNSTDGSVSAMNSDYPEVSIVANEQNLGFTGGVNAGMRSTEADLVFISTPDMIVTQSWCHRLLSEMNEDNNIGAATGIIIRPSGKIDGRGSLRDPNFDFYIAPPSDNVSTVDSGRGSGLLVRRNAFDEVGGIDDDLFIQWDEVGLTFNLKNSGYKTVFVPGALAWHNEPLGGSSLHYYNARNRYLLAGRHTSGLDLIRIIITNLWRDLARSLILFLLRKREYDATYKRIKGAAVGVWTLLLEKI